MTNARTLMLGWEFPPFISGGLGTACYGLTKAMDQLGINVSFVLPKRINGKSAEHVKLLGPHSFTSSPSVEFSEFKSVTFHTIHSPLKPYSTDDVYQQRIEKTIKQKQEVPGEAGLAEECTGGMDYSCDMYTEVHRYAAVAAQLARTEQFDIVHAHDWMTYPAGIAAAAATGKPLIVHVHSTEFDRSGENINKMIYDIEREGMQAADKVIAVSSLTRDIIIHRYGISDEKVEVVHNGVDRKGVLNPTQNRINKNEKIVLFLGRITMQKGPEYFIQAAKKVLETIDNVKFIMAGDGDMMDGTIELASQLGIGDKVQFTGFLHGVDVQKIYKMADLFVMPSVSEPFGIVPLEALDNDVPVIISKQSGVSEVLNHVLKVDFWDINEMANKIIAVLKHLPLKETLRQHGNFEVRKLRWKESALKCSQIYQELLAEI